MKKQIHRYSAMLAFLCILTFLISTTLVELFGSNESVAMVKSWIVFPGLFILVPAIALTGMTGAKLFKQFKNHPLVQKKAKRMPFIAVNGVVILVPAALVLSYWAELGQFDGWFYTVQCLELLAGATNLILMGLNIRDGFAIRGKSRKG